MSKIKEGAERRVFAAQIRADDANAESRMVYGYAAVFNKSSEKLGWFVEYITPGAFANAITKSDCRGLFNHDDNYILCRQSANTLKLEEDATGLKFEFEMPDTTYGNDLLFHLRKGNVKECSFQFTTKVSRWVWATKEGEVDTRYVDEVDDLYDISLVTFPAYPDTTVALRSKEGRTNTPPARVTDEEIIAQLIKINS